MAAQRLNLAPVRRCPLGKRRLHTEAEAEAAAAELRRSDRFNRPTAGPVAAYYCGDCGAWHVGHKA